MNRERNLYSRSVLLAVASAMAVSLFSASVAAQQETKTFNIEAQPLGTALTEFSEQSDIIVMAPGALVQGKRAPAVEGAITPEVALEKLLQGSGLEAKRDASGAIFIAAQAEKIEAPQRRNTQRLTESAEAYEAEAYEIVVVGTNIRGVIPESSPLFVLNREEIQQTGFTSVERLLETLPQNLQSGVGQENFGVFRAGAGSGEQGAGVNLRGLGQRATLVLVDGKRLAPSGEGAFVDVSLIPLSAIERVEVLPSGASALYGSDAVGGVVNFVLRKDYEGLETSIQYGGATQGGGAVFQASQLGGAHWGSGSAVISYDYRQENRITAGQRDFTLNLPAPSLIAPEEERHAVFAAFEQELNPALSVELTGLYSTRDTVRTRFDPATILQNDAEADSEFFSIAGDIVYNLSESWRAKLGGAFAKNNASSIESQPEGVGFINSVDRENEVLSINLLVDGDVVEIPGGAVKVAIGAQHRTEDFASASQTNTGLVQGLPPTIRGAARHASAIFGEIFMPIVGRENSSPGFQRLELTAAARFEDYNDVGSSADPRIGILYQPFVGLKLRGTYDTSFRAPLLPESAGEYSGFLVDSAGLVVDPTLSVSGVALSLIGSDPEVTPEESETWTAGLVLEPSTFPGLAIDLNYFNTTFVNRIAQPSGTIAVIGNPAFDSIVTLGPSLTLVNELLDGATTVSDFSGPNFTPGTATPEDVVAIVDIRVSNTAIAETDGLDLSVSYGFDIGNNQFSTFFNSTFLFGFDERLTPNSQIVENLNRPFEAIDFRFRGGVSWLQGDFRAGLFVNHVDSYIDDRFEDDLTIDSFTTIDLSIGYKFQISGSVLDGVSVDFSVLNLFDQGPPRLETDPLLAGSVGFDTVNASGRGRFISGRITKQW